MALQAIRSSLTSSSPCLFSGKILSFQRKKKNQRENQKCLIHRFYLFNIIIRERKLRFRFWVWQGSKEKDSRKAVT